jgi:hypothetical protein
MKMLKTAICVGCLLFAMAFVPGCLTMSELIGAGDAGVGYSSTARVFFYHTVDGDKEGKTATSQFETKTDLVGAVLGDGDGEDVPTEVETAADPPDSPPD